MFNASSYKTLLICSQCETELTSPEFLELIPCRCLICARCSKSINLFPSSTSTTNNDDDDEKTSSHHHCHQVFSLQKAHPILVKLVSDLQHHPQHQNTTPTTTSSLTASDIERAINIRTNIASADSSIDEVALNRARQELIKEREKENAKEKQKIEKPVITTNTDRSRQKEQKSDEENASSLIKNQQRIEALQQTLKERKKKLASVQRSSMKIRDVHRRKLTIAIEQENFKAAKQVKINKLEKRIATISGELERRSSLLLLARNATENKKDNKNQKNDHDDDMKRDSDFDRLLKELTSANDDDDDESDDQDDDFEDCSDHQKEENEECQEEEEFGDVNRL